MPLTTVEIASVFDGPENPAENEVEIVRIDPWQKRLQPLLLAGHFFGQPL